MTAPEAAHDGGRSRAGFVALVGRPNVGKSTLLNRLVGAKISIVSDKPQTTRSRVTGVVHRPAAQIALVDTPGLHRPLHRMNERMVRAALAVLDGVDVVVALTDATEPLGRGDEFLLRTLAGARAPVVLVVNKVDLVEPKTALLPVIERWSRRFAFADVYPISAATGEGTEELLAGLERLLPEGERPYDEDFLTDVSERFLAAEIVRERILAETREEIPYTTTVLIEHWEDPEGAETAEPGAAAAPRSGGDAVAGAPRAPARRPRVCIEASVLVERESQKGILVGRAGRMIKAIGSRARAELEALLGRPVYLGLQVKVRPEWRENDRLLDRLGIGRS